MVNRVKLSNPQQIVLDRVDRAIAFVQQQPQISTFGIRLVLEGILEGIELRKYAPGSEVRTMPTAYINPITDVSMYHAFVCGLIDRGESDKGPNQRAAVDTLIGISNQYRPQDAKVIHH